jgi:hypothetical protein
MPLWLGVYVAFRGEAIVYSAILLGAVGTTFWAFFVAGTIEIIVWRSNRLVAAPGTLASRVLAFLVPRKAYMEIFVQAIADMREEHADALSRGQRIQAS